MKSQEDLETNEQEISTKRKHSSNNNNNNSISQQDLEGEDDEDFDLTLSLSFGRPPRSKKKTTLNTTRPQLSLSLPPPATSLSVTDHQPLPQHQDIPQIEIPPDAQMTPRPLGPLQLSPKHAPFTDIPVTEPLLYTTAPINHESSMAGPSRAPRTRRNPSQGPREGKGETVPVLYPWAMDRRAMVHSLDYLLSRRIETITGLVQCKRCEKQFELGFDLRAKFVEIGAFISQNKSFMHDRAPSDWMNPVLPRCQFCDQENSVKPVIANKKQKINWLFLLLGQMLGCCTLDQLKYFCKHTKNHRTGAKDRVLYLAYLGMCKQLDPNGPFDR
jgi:hypothetical protein